MHSIFLCNVVKTIFCFWTATTQAVLGMGVIAAAPKFLLTAKNANAGTARMYLRATHASKISSMHVALRNSKATATATVSTNTTTTTTATTFNGHCQNDSQKELGRERVTDGVVTGSARPPDRLRTSPSHPPHAINAQIRALIYMGANARGWGSQGGSKG